MTCLPQQPQAKVAQEDLGIGLELERVMRVGVLVDLAVEGGELPDVGPRGDIVDDAIASGEHQQDRHADVARHEAQVNVEANALDEKSGRGTVKTPRVLAQEAQPAWRRGKQLRLIERDGEKAARRSQ